MSRLFTELVESNLFKDWANTLDWLFDDESRFSEQKGWSRGYVGAFIKRIKKMPNWCKDENYHYGQISLELFEKLKNSSCTDTPKIYMSKSNGEGRDLIRHIRNGIAHGKTYPYKHNGVLCVKIFDYNKNKVPTAYISFPIHYIIEIHKNYLEQEKIIAHNRKKAA